jgi:hypothetical protein
MKKRLRKLNRRPPPTVEGPAGGPYTARKMKPANPLPITPGHREAALALPHDPALPARARDLWLEGNWLALGRLDPEQLANHPARAQLSAIQAAALQQVGDRSSARTLARRALHWGCSREDLGQALLAGARHTLARASLLARRDTQAQGHFERAVPQARLSSEVRRLTQARRDHLEADLRRAIDAASKLRQGGASTTSLQAPRWLQALASQCLNAPDMHDAADRVMAEVVTLPGDRLQLLMLLSDHMLARGDRMTALHFLNSARWFTGDASADTRTALMKKLLALGAPNTALDIAMADVLDDEAQSGEASVVQVLRKTYEGMRHAATSRLEHGHELLLAFLETQRVRLQQLAAPRQLTLIEIGTTREDVPGQGSTLKLAQYCLQHQLHFITVDMDPHNTRMALATFGRLGANHFEAVTMKGEDYLRQRKGDIDLVFLDAYDFDHGKHSELRQSRYERYLGTRIDEQACHRMHLDCAQTLVSKLWAHGVVCVDDTWQEDGTWSAKGTLAMPHLLAKGFRVVDARNRAALLVRQASAAS